MPSPNPLYQYTSIQHESSYQHRADRFGVNYWLIPLPELIDAEHHISIYETIDESVGYGSVYHYTLTNENQAIHIYANEKNKILGSSVEELATGEIKKLTAYSTEEQQKIEKFFEIYALPVMQTLQAQHEEYAKNIGLTYRQLLEQLNNSLFENSSDTSHSIALAEQAQDTGAGASNLSYQHKTFYRKTLSYLEKCLDYLANPPKSVATSATPTSTSDKQPLSHPVTQEKPSKSSKKKKKKQNKKAAAPVAKTIDNEQLTKVSINFTNAYSQYQQAWLEFTSCSLSDFAEKIRLFTQLKTYISNLLIESLEVMNNREHFTDNQLLLRQAELETTMMQDAIQQAGLELLEICMQSESLLAEHGQTLRLHAPLLNQSHFELAIKSNNTAALSFLIDNTKTDINSFLVATDDPSEPHLTLLSLAYKNQQFDIFELLIKKGAKGLGLYNDLPLAHTLLQLSTEDQFANTFRKYCKNVIDGDYAFYKKLAMAVQLKLKEQELSEEEREVLKNAKTAYTSTYTNNRNTNLNYSQNLRDNVTAISQHVAGSEMDELKNDPMYNMLLEQLNAASTKLYELAKKQRKNRALIKESENYYAQMRTYFDGSIYNQLIPCKEVLYQELREKIEQVQAKITVLELDMTGKRLNARQVKDLKDAKLVILNAERKHALSLETLSLQNMGSRMLQESIKNLTEMSEDKDSLDALGDMRGSMNNMLSSLLNLGLIRDSNTLESIEKLQSTISSSTSTKQDGDAKLPSLFDENASAPITSSHATSPIILFPPGEEEGASAEAKAKAKASYNKYPR